MSGVESVALNEKQARFAAEYIIDLNATQAAIRAGYSEASAGAIGSENLQKPEIAAEIDRLKAARAETTQINADWVLRRLAAEAEADVGDLYYAEGRLKPVKEWPKIWRQGLVAGVKTQVSEDGVALIDVKLADRVRRLELIGKHISVKAFEETVNVKGLEGLADRLARAEQRGDE